MIQTSDSNICTYWNGIILSMTQKKSAPMICANSLHRELQRRCLLTATRPIVLAAKALPFCHAWPKGSSIWCVSGSLLLEHKWLLISIKPNLNYLLTAMQMAINLKGSLIRVFVKAPGRWIISTGQDGTQNGKMIYSLDFLFSTIMIQIHPLWNDGRMEFWFQLLEKVK